MKGGVNAMKTNSFTNNTCFLLDTQGQKDILVHWIKAILLFILMIVFLLSCAEMPPTKRSLPSRTYDLLPQILHEKIVHILQDPPLNLRVMSAYNGKIETDYMEYEGEFHGILFWKKRWKERIKYFISIDRDWHSPERSCLSIYSITEHRPNENYLWAFKGSASTKDKVAQILEVIDSGIRR